MNLKKLYLFILIILFMPYIVLASSNETGNNGRCASYRGNAFLGGKYIELGISPRGSYGALSVAPSNFHTSGNRSTIGLRFNNNSFDSNKFSDIGDFILPGDAEERYMIGYISGAKEGEANEIKIAEKSGVSIFPNPIKDLETTISCDFKSKHMKAITSGISKDNLKINIVTEFDNDSKYFKTTVELENLSNDTLSDVRYVRSINPNQDYDYFNSYETLNKVISNPKPPYENGMMAVVVSKGIRTESAFLYVSYDSRARVSVGNTKFPSSVYNNDLWIESMENVPTTVTEKDMLDDSDYVKSDGYIALTFNLGELEPGKKVTFSYFSSLIPTIKEGLDLIDVMSVNQNSINIKNYSIKSNKKDILTIDGVDIGDKVEMFLDYEGKNKVLDTYVTKDNYKNNKFIYRLDKNILDDEGGVIYFLITNNYESSNLISYDYGSYIDTNNNLLPKIFIYVISLTLVLLVGYIIYNKIND